MRPEQTVEKEHVPPPALGNINKNLRQVQVGLGRDCRRLKHSIKPELRTLRYRELAGPAWSEFYSGNETLYGPVALRLILID